MIRRKINILFKHEIQTHTIKTSIYFESGLGAVHKLREHLGIPSWS